MEEGGFRHDSALVGWCCDQVPYVPHMGHWQGVVKLHASSKSGVRAPRGGGLVSPATSLVGEGDRKVCRAARCGGGLSVGGLPGFATPAGCGFRGRPPQLWLCTAAVVHVPAPPPQPAVLCHATRQAAPAGAPAGLWRRSAPLRPMSATIVNYHVSDPPLEVVAGTGDPPCRGCTGRFEGSPREAPTAVLAKTSHANCHTTLTNRRSRGRRGRFVRVVPQLAYEVLARPAVYVPAVRCPG